MDSTRTNSRPSIATALRHRRVAPPLPHKPKWQEFLNSSFGLWLLSAVLITGLGSALTLVLKRFEEEEKRQKQVERLDLEIASRLSQILFHFEFVVSTGHWRDQALKRKQELQALKNSRSTGLDIYEKSRLEAAEKEVAAKELLLKDFPHPLNSLQIPDNTNIVPLFPEYKDLSVRALFAELYRVVLPSERQNVRELLANVSAEFLDVRHQPIVRAESFVCSQAEAIRDKLVSLRWKEAPFPNLDCKADGPFCRVQFLPSGERKATTNGTYCFKGAQ